MTTHVFIVDDTTFKIHLENMFAGTGMKKKTDNKKDNNVGVYIDFNNCISTNLKSQVEDTIVGMSADACRIRRGDKIIFYLQQTKDRHTNEPKEGKFFGIFQAKDDWSFIDNYDDNQFLNRELNKSLTFRVEIIPDKVFQYGVSEWEALDEIKHIISPYQMLWSLIYRKLRGLRGNTMITLYEEERLRQLIRDKNARVALNNTKKFSFNVSEQKIIQLNENIVPYQGTRKEPINFLPRLINKYKLGKAFEKHLQAYILTFIGKNLNQSLDNAVLPAGCTINWIGNEVGCGVGMQSIDIALECQCNDQKILIPIELKSTELPQYITNQIKRYVDWITQYYKPNRQCDIYPMIICKKHKDKTQKQRDNFDVIINHLREFNDSYQTTCEKITLIEFELDLNEQIIFSKYDY